MGRTRSLVILTGIVLVGLCLPAVALAGTYSWDLPANFTTTAPGANPDHDNYGATPWSYVDAAGPLVGAPSFQPLAAFRSPTRGGLAGWSRDPSSSDELIAANPASTTLTDGTDFFPVGQLVMTPSTGREVAVGWNSPLSHSATATVTGSITSADPNTCASKFTWSLDDQNGMALQSGGSSDTISASPTVSPSRAIYLVVRPSVLHDAECDTALVSLHITASDASRPTVTLDSPANGALISGGQPTFAGSASTALGAAPTVTVRVYAGASPAGTPVETLTATRSASGGYSVGPDAALADGQYTAQAEQDDLSNPANAAFSAPSTFVIHNAPATIRLDSPGSKPLTNATPTLTGQAAASASPVGLVTYPGAGTNATPVRYSSGTPDSTGHFSIRITPALPDGQYTVVAAQAGSAPAGLSNAVTLRIKVHPPALTLALPATGSNVGSPQPRFSGAAGSALGDSRTVTVKLYGGSSVKAHLLGTMRAAVHGSQWSGVFPFRLRLGPYTARATQTDDAGHTARTASHTFLVVSAPSVIGSAVRVSRSGVASVPITCVAPAGQVCVGNVLILTVQSLRPSPGGPSGSVRVLFAYVSIPAGTTERVSRPLRADVARALRQAKSIRLRVTAILTGNPRSSATRTLRIVR